MKELERHYIKKYEPFWGNWLLEAFIGEGSYGKVYKISKTEWGFKAESALKIISVPSKEQFREAKSTVGENPDRLEEYFSGIVGNIINEIRLLYRLRGNSNIVSYEDHVVEKHQNGTGWDILIRMEFVMPISGTTSCRNMTEEEIIKLGRDICSALVCCSRHGIIHRDIKEENIFISQDGNFKLGDFGIAREMSSGKNLSSIRGTPVYLAPEVFRGGGYDERSDIYSLGILLYKLANRGRYPFMPSHPAKVKCSDGEAAIVRRLSGEPVPGLKDVSAGLEKIIMKACEFEPDKRYSNAGEMKKEIEELILSDLKEEWYIDLGNGSLSRKKESFSKSYESEDEVKIKGEWVYL